jgi:hypothetical protein
MFQFGKEDCTSIRRNVYSVIFMSGQEVQHNDL